MNEQPGRKDPRSEGYATGRATKQVIVEQAATAFAQKGFYGTSLRGIAREAGIDHTLLLHHFRNKTALLLTVIAWYDERHGVPPEELIERERLPAGISLPEALTQAASRNESTPGLVRLLSVLSAEAGEEDHPAREALQRRQDQLVGVLAATITEQETAGAGVGDTIELTAEERAVLILSTWEGLQVFDALHPGRINLPKLLGETARRISPSVNVAG